MNKDILKNKARKLAFEQGISEEEAMELTELLLSQEFIEGDSAEEVEEVDDIEMEAINKDFDTQMAHDNNDEAALETATQELSVAVAKLRSRKRAKLAQDLTDPNDPAKQRLDRLMLRASEEFGNDPNIAPENLDYARTMLADMGPNTGVTDEEEEYKLFLDLAGANNQNRVARMLAANSEPRFGVPEEEGKLYRSWVNPRYFKSAAGNLYKMAIETVDQGEGAATAPAPQDDADQGHAISEQERQRYQQLVADATANGRSYSFLLGITHHFTNDEKLRALAGNSETEMAEFEQGRHSASSAMGGGQQADAAPAAPAQTPAPALAKKSNVEDDINFMANDGFSVVDPMGEPDKSDRGGIREFWYQRGKEFADQGGLASDAETQAAKILDEGRGGMVAHDSFLAGFGDGSGAPQPEEDFDMRF